MKNPLRPLAGTVLVVTLVAGSWIALRAQTTGDSLTADQQKYRPGRPDLSKAGFQVMPVQGNVYLIVTGAGSNIVVQAGDQGAILVDASVPEVSDRVIAEVRRLTKGPIRAVVDTSMDPDHIGGNASISAAGQPMFQGNTGYQDRPQATIFAHEKGFNQVSLPGSPMLLPERLWPTDTFFTTKKKLFFNHEPIEIRWTPALTDANVIVWFRSSDVIAAGDVFTTMSYPKFDRTRGGSIQGVLDGLNGLVDIAIPEFNQQGGTRIVPAHGRIGNQSDVVEYRDMATIVRDRVHDAREAGMTLDRIKALNITREYDGVYATPAFTGAMFVEAIYDDLSRQPTSR
jgi:glyoxylase-like metal-dependent hydrolase (beta-lactamase superfamily II)